MTAAAREDDGFRNLGRDSAPRPPFRLGPVIPAVVVIIVGLAFLLDNLDLVESRQVLRLWPVLLVVFGVKHVIEARDRGTALNGTLLAGAGGLLLLDNLNVIDFNVWELWPLVLIAFGLRMLTSATSNPAAPVDSAESAEASHAFLGSVERRNRSADFRGGSASAFWGGVTLDLTEADIAEDQAVLQVSAIMGGIEIRIPEEWSVESNVTALMGGVEDKTRGPVVATKRLIVQGSVLMGGVEIRN